MHKTLNWKSNLRINPSFEFLVVVKTILFAKISLDGTRGGGFTPLE